jgi:hypothetical protein
MEPELKAKVKIWEESKSPELAKKLFIRDSAREAYKTGNGSIKEVTSNTLKEVIDLVTVGSMTKEEIGIHISNLETARSYLSALTQGYQIAFAEEKEPEFKAKALERAKSERKSSSKPKTLEESLSKLGIDMNKLFSALSNNQAKAETVKAEVPENNLRPTPSPLNLVKCPKCQKEFTPTILSFHKC